LRAKLIDAAHQKSAKESGIVALWTAFKQKPWPQNPLPSWLSSLLAFWS